MKKSIFPALSAVFLLTGILQANPADIFPSGKVDMVDFAVFAAAWLSDDSPSANWNPDCDISDSNDGFINGLDLAVLAENWLWTAQVVSVNVLRSDNGNANVVYRDNTYGVFNSAVGSYAWNDVSNKAVNPSLVDSDGVTVFATYNVTGQDGRGGGPGQDDILNQGFWDNHATMTITISGLIAGTQWNVVVLHTPSNVTENVQANSQVSSDYTATIAGPNYVDAFDGLGGSSFWYIKNATADANGELIVTNTGSIGTNTLQGFQLQGDFSVLEAWNPKPADEAIDVDPNVLLEWTPGAYPALHKVYLDPCDLEVINRSPACDVNGVTTTDPNYYPGPLNYSTTYYWAVDEVNEAGPDPCNWQGDVWNFTVR